MSSNKPLSTKKLVYFPSLNEVSIGYGSPREELFSTSLEVKCEKLLMPSSPTQTAKSMGLKSPREKVLVFGGQPKTSEKQPTSPKNLDALQIIRNLGIKPTIFQSLRPKNQQEVKPMIRPPTSRKNSEATPRLTAVQQKPSGNVVSFPSLTIESPKYGKSSSMLKFDKPKSVPSSQKMSPTKPILKKLDSICSYDMTFQKESSRSLNNFDAYFSHKQVRFVVGQNEESD